MLYKVSFEARQVIAQGRLAGEGGTKDHQLALVHKEHETRDEEAIAHARMARNLGRGQV